MLSCAIAMLFSCSPLTKEAYLEEYKLFITEISDNASEYDDGDWERAKKKFDKYSVRLKEEYASQLTTKEKIQITGYEATYGYHYTLYQSKNAIDRLLETMNVSEIRSTVEKYAEKDMEKDLEKLYKKAKKIGGETLKAIEDIFDELDIKY